MRRSSTLFSRRARVATAATAFAGLFAVAAGCSTGSGEPMSGQMLGLGGDAGDAPMCRLGAACAPGAPCPDLTIDSNRLRTSAYVATRDFLPSDCAIVEGCIAIPGHRSLLRFDTATPNIGTGDLVLGPPSTSNACFQYSSCHNHYHFQNYANYVLYAPDGTTVVATGHKQAFCLEDMGPAAGQSAPTPPFTFTCSNQGIHRGYQDIYSSGLDCQWIDVTNVPPGNYVLSVTVNYAHVVAELDYTNNEVRVPVTIPGAPSDGGADAGHADAGADAGHADAGSGDAGTVDPCSAFGGCAACAGNPSCGWCNDGLIGCHTGTAQGANGGACAIANWAFGTNACAPPPPPDAGPETSTGDDGGTTTTDASTTTDDASAPDASVTPDDASVTPDAASTDPCAQLSGCGACTAAATCGWCNDTGGCLTGTANGPNGSSCAWAWISTQCTMQPPPPPDDSGTTTPDAGTSTDPDAAQTDACNAFSDCQSCTAQPVCGWCGSSCNTGTASGPNNGACTQTDWAWISTSCH
jgi:hypothetical protein